MEEKLVIIKSDEKIAEMRGRFAQDGEKWVTNASGATVEEIIEKVKRHWGDNVRVDREHVIDGKGDMFSAEKGCSKGYCQEGEIFVAVYAQVENSENS